MQLWQLTHSLCCRHGHWKVQHNHKYLHGVCVVSSGRGGRQYNVRTYVVTGVHTLWCMRWACGIECKVCTPLQNGWAQVGSCRELYSVGQEYRPVSQTGSRFCMVSLRMGVFTSMQQTTALSAPFYRRNIPDDDAFLKTCLFDPNSEVNKSCPIFTLKSIVEMIGGSSTFDDLATEVGITLDCGGAVESWGAFRGVFPPYSQHPLEIYQALCHLYPARLPPILLEILTFKDLRLQLFNFCYLLSQTFFELPMASKTHFILNNYNSLIAKLLYRMYTHSQSLLFSH